MKILSRKEVLHTPWFNLIAKKTADDPSPYYSLKMRDYVTVVAVTKQRKILLVSQYRPAVEKRVLELPSGHVDKGETPLSAARRELLEETGYKAGRLQFLGCLLPDTGRHSNLLWCFFCPNAILDTSAKPESGLRVKALPKNALLRKVRLGSFNHALNMAVLSLAMIKGKL